MNGFELLTHHGWDGCEDLAKDNDGCEELTKAIKAILGLLVEHSGSNDTYRSRKVSRAIKNEYRSRNQYRDALDKGCSKEHLRVLYERAEFLERMCLVAKRKQAKLNRRKMQVSRLKALRESESKIIHFDINRKVGKIR